ncbi:MAG: hypothetical protein HRU70_08615 [Phycisphaeraceae bacterium]|nr:MAG: hypothetical protein HRU70_08615 [Phycisphaeraceae bacterium]
MATILVYSTIAITSDEQARAWFDRVVAHARSGLDSLELKITYRVESLEPLDTTQIPALRARVKDFPEHPDRILLDRLERFERFGPEIRTQTVWVRHGQLRISREPTLDPGSFYYDLIDFGDSGWSLTPTQLSLVGTRDSRPRGQSFASPISASALEVHDFIAPGAATLARADVQRFILDPTGRWSAESVLATPAGPRAYVVRGRWDPSRGAGAFAGSQLHESGLDSKVISTLEASDHRPTAGMLSDPASVLMYASQASPPRRATLVALAALDPAEFKAVTARPTLNGSDPIRGPVTFTQINDYTGRDAEYRVADEKREFQTVAVEETPEGRQRAWLRRAGWALAAGILVTIVLLRVKQARSA